MGKREETEGGGRGGVGKREGREGREGREAGGRGGEEGEGGTDNWRCGMNGRRGVHADACTCKQQPHGY